MNEKEFQESYRERVQEALNFVLDSEYSDFYREKYKGLGIDLRKINTLEDFQKIPPLEKEELLRTPVDGRIFVPREEVYFYSASSGTTNQRHPLITPRIDEGKSEEGDDLREKGATRALMLLPNSLAVTKSRIVDLPIIVGDPNNLSLAAKTSLHTRVDTIITTPTILMLFIESLKAVGFNFNEIKAISIGAEYCTKQKADYLQKLFPKAFFRFYYGSSEIGGAVGYRCKHLAQKAPSLFHIRDVNLLEIDEKTGEIICTNLTRKAFPLIRYKTGDVGAILKESCQCGSNVILDLKGRLDYDSFRTSGAIIHIQAIADAIATLSNALTPAFQVHIYEKSSSGKPMIALELHIIPIREMPDSENKIARQIEKNLYLSATKTLADFVDRGLFLPLTVKFVTELPSDGKSRNIVSHLS